MFVESAQAATRIFLTEQESAGTPPDLFLFNRFFDFPWVFRSGLVQPFDRHLQQDQTEPLENFLPAALELVATRAKRWRCQSPLTSAWRGTIPGNSQMPAFLCLTRAGLERTLWRLHNG